jgi:hypothetical protein
MRFEEAIPPPIMLERRIMEKKTLLSDEQNSHM